MFNDFWVRNASGSAYGFLVLFLCACHIPFHFVIRREQTQKICRIQSIVIACERHQNYYYRSMFHASKGSKAKNPYAGKRYRPKHRVTEIRIIPRGEHRDAILEPMDHTATQHRLFGTPCRDSNANDWVS